MLDVIAAWHALLIDFGDRGDFGSPLPDPKFGEAIRGTK
jgi:hypothetical protein